MYSINESSTFKDRTKGVEATAELIIKHGSLVECKPLIYPEKNMQHMSTVLVQLQYLLCDKGYETV